MSTRGIIPWICLVLVFGFILGFFTRPTLLPETTKESPARNWEATFEKVRSMIRHLRDVQSSEEKTGRDIAEWMRKATNGEDTTEAKDKGMITLTYYQLHHLNNQLFESKLGLRNAAVTAEGLILKAEAEMALLVQENASLRHEKPAVLRELSTMRQAKERAYELFLESHKTND